MTITLACYSIVLRKSTLEEKYRGGLEAFTKKYFCWGLTSDEYLVKISFMSTFDIEVVIKELVERGLEYDWESDRSLDFVAADKYTGPFWDVDWLEFGFKECRLKESLPCPE